jgi:diguanylate cyclase (GGDEF)-like protein
MNLHKGDRLLRRLSRGGSVTISVLLTVLIGLLDYLTGHHFRIAILYILPVFWATWRVGLWPGLGVAGLSAAGWLICDLTGRDASVQGLVAYWNTAVTILAFALAAVVLSALKSERLSARTCPLTGILNRFGFFEAAAEEILSARRLKRPLTLAFLDCDNFKAVNDSGGHEEGDRLLREIGTALRTKLRKIDVFARLGGDEFAALLPDCAPEEAEAAILRMKDHLTARMRENDWPVTFSIGAVAFHVPPESTDEMLRLADNLMYEVKGLGKNALRFVVAGEPARPIPKA